MGLQAKKHKLTQAHRHNRSAEKNGESEEEWEKRRQQYCNCIAAVATTSYQKRGEKKRIHTNAITIDGENEESHTRAENKWK